MENVAEALEMAGMILVFLIALSVSMSSFTTVRTAIDNITETSEMYDLAKDSSGYINYIEARNNEATRVVGAETVVSSMYRSIKENYVIYVKFKNSSSYPSYCEKYKSDEIGKIGNTILYNQGDELLKVTIGCNQNINYILQNGLYRILANKSFNEYLGEWQNSTDVSEENKVTYRIITYIEI